MAKVKVQYEKLPYQQLFHDSIKPKVFLSAGYGAGKTFSLCMKGLQLADRNRGLAGGILAPDLKMFKRDVWPTFDEIADLNKFKIKFNRNESTLYLPNTDTTIYIFHAQDAGQSIRGPNIAWGLINEVTLIDEPSFKAFLARIRIKEAALRQLAMSGTPEGFNWTYDYFVSDPRADTDLIFGDMRLNRFVADDYAQGLIDSYDNIMVEQFVGGKYVNTNGLSALYKFDRRKHGDDTIKRIPGLPVWVNIDFNVTPMAATFWNRCPDRPGEPSLIGFDELCIENTDTAELADAIWDKLGTDDSIVLFPDPAGNARTTKSSKTDIQILREKGFDDIRFPARIKSVKDCLLSANAFVGKNRARINPKTCKNTVQDFEQCILKPGTNELDKSNLKRTHWLDGFKNMIHHEFPIVIGAGSWRETKFR